MYNNQQIIHQPNTHCTLEHVAVYFLDNHHSRADFKRQI